MGYSTVPLCSLAVGISSIPCEHCTGVLYIFAILYSNGFARRYAFRGFKNSFYSNPISRNPWALRCLGGGKPCGVHAQCCRFLCTNGYCENLHFSVCIRINFLLGGDVNMDLHSTIFTPDNVIHPLVISESRPSHSAAEAINRQSRFFTLRRLELHDDSSCTRPFTAPQQRDEGTCDSSVLPWGLQYRKIVDLVETPECSTTTRIETSEFLADQIRDTLDAYGAEYLPYVDESVLNALLVKTPSTFSSLHDATTPPIKNNDTEALRIGISNRDLPPYFYSSMVNGTRIARGVVIDSLNSALNKWNALRDVSIQPLELQLFSVDCSLLSSASHGSEASDLSGVSSFLDAVVVLVPDGQSVRYPWTEVRSLREFGQCALTDETCGALIISEDSSDSYIVLSVSDSSAVLTRTTKSSTPSTIIEITKLSEDSSWSFAEKLTAYEAGMIDSMTIDPMTAAWTALQLNNSKVVSSLSKRLGEQLVLAFR